MSTIEVAVAGRDIQVKQGYEKPSAGDVNTCEVSIAIESGGVWDSLPHKRVTFATRTASVTVDYAPTITIPHEVMASPGALYLTLTGYDADGIEVARTHRMTYPIEVAKAGADEGAEPSPATLDVVSRIDALAADLEEKRDTDYWRGEPGAPGVPGEPGADGYSPIANVTKNGGTATITVTDKNGTTTATVSDGAPGKDGSDASATNVRINGESITTDGVADIPLSKYNKPGVCGIGTGLQVNTFGVASIINPIDEEVTTRMRNVAVTCSKIDYAVKAAMCDGKGAAWTADEQASARERMNSADANKVYIMQKQIENLQGIAATEETDSTEAYTKTVPTGAQKWASLDKVGGKTVVWNQLIRVRKVTFTTDTDTNGGNWIRPLTEVNDQTPLKAGNKYLKISSDPKITFNNGSTTAGLVLGIYTALSYDESDYRWYAGVPGGQVLPAGTYDVEFAIVSLTKFFGAGNEPTSIDDERIQFIKTLVESRPEYNPGELMSAEVVEVESKGKNLLGTFPIPAEVRDMCPGYGWSAGTVCNEIDFAAKKYVQRVGKADADSVTWSLGSNTTNENGVGFLAANVLNVTNPSQDASRYLISNIKLGTGLWGTSTEDEFWLNAGTLFFRFKTSKTSGITLADGLARMRELGAVCYYPLPEPIEVDLSNVLTDDHFIEVEAGGTVTFKQASTQLPVPSSITYQISTSEVIANA